MKRTIILGIAASLLLAAIPAVGANGNADAKKTDADAAIRENLQRQIKRLSFADIDLKEVIAFLREYSGANIQVNWKALTMAGIEQTTKVSVDVRKITVKRALELLLRDVTCAAAGADVELCYMIDGGVLLISTKWDLAKKPIRRIYDVRGLLVKGGSASDVLQKAKALVPMIRMLIDPESWAAFGDSSSPTTPGLIHLRAGRLVVTQTGPNHQALAELIEQLREAQATAQNRQASIKGKPDPDAALREKLTRKIDRFSFNGAGLQNVIRFLRKNSGANIYVNRRALANAGIELTTKVHVDVRKVTVEQALDLVLRDASAAAAAAGTDAELRYVIDGGVLTISTNSDLAKVPVRRAYDVRDLLMRGGSGATPHEMEMARDAMMENLIRLIRNSIDPESWADPEGGGVGTGTPGFVQMFGGALVVAQTAVNHKAVAELLDDLRKAKAAQHRKVGTAAEPAADAALREKLTRKMERLSFDDIDFLDVITFLGEYSGTNIHVNWRALQAGGIKKITKVSVDVRKITVKQALDMVLRQVSGKVKVPDAELGYVIDRDVLIISTGPDFARKPIRRVYDVRDLLKQEGSGATPRETDTATQKLMEYLIRLILVRNTIDCESWADPQAGVGPGTPGFIQLFDGLLVVTQTAPNHKALAELLRELRKAKAVAMQPRTQSVREEDVGFADVPQELDLPRVGNLVKFEKTLIRPADRLTIRAEYTWKGAVK